MIKRIDHVEITTGNLQKTLDFYHALGFKIKEQNKMSRPPLEEIDYLTLGDTMIEILAVKDPAPLSTNVWQVGYRMMALEVDDMDKTVAELKSKGIELSRPYATMGKSKRGEIKDPNGISIELRQW
ncbi:MAG: VOC family protein [Chloroflexi bacterium]|nr:VOC family protein [Chloroflexota bacterium]